MQQGINLEQIKQYNASLREYKDKSNKLRAELEFNEQELNRQCSELSKELGITVTPDNVKEILEERLAKINNTLSVGTEILERVKAEEAAVNANSINGNNTGASEASNQYMNNVNNIAVDNSNMPVGQMSTEPGFMSFGGELPPIFATNQNNI